MKSIILTGSIILGLALSSTAQACGAVGIDAHGENIGVVVDDKGDCSQINGRVRGRDINLEIEANGYGNRVDASITGSADVRIRTTNGGRAAVMSGLCPNGASPRRVYADGSRSLAVLRCH